MRILVTGADGFLGRNLCLRLKEKGLEVIKVTRETEPNSLFDNIVCADFIFHFAGTNRSKVNADFVHDNIEFSRLICHYIEKTKKQIPVVFTSSIHADSETIYGQTKKEAENIFFHFSERVQNPVVVVRLPNLFGKWCKPDYNSVVATFCYRIANDLPIEVVDPKQSISLAYIDDVVFYLIGLVKSLPSTNARKQILTFDDTYEATIESLATKLYEFKSLRDTLLAPEAGVGFERALYATFLSYIPPERFVYPIKQNKDPRGSFVEFLKTSTHGQVSFFTSGQQVIRGKHYHHTKSEKFIILKGVAEFRFKNIANGETHNVTIDSQVPQIVETIPGWLHEVENIGSDELIGLVWANEVFDKENPDTFLEMQELFKN